MSKAVAEEDTCEIMASALPMCRKLMIVEKRPPQDSRIPTARATPRIVWKIARLHVVLVIRLIRSGHELAATSCIIVYANPRIASPKIECITRLAV